MPGLHRAPADGPLRPWPFLAVAVAIGLESLVSYTNVRTTQTTIWDRVGFAGVLVVAGVVILLGLVRQRGFGRIVPSWPLFAWSGWMVLEVVQFAWGPTAGYVSATTDLLVTTTPLLFYLAYIIWRPSDDEVRRAILIVAGLSLVGSSVAWLRAGPERFEPPALLPVVLFWVLAAAPLTAPWITRRVRIASGVVVLLQLVVIIAARGRTPLVAWVVVGFVCIVMPGAHRRRRLLALGGTMAAGVLVLLLALGTGRMTGVTDELSRQVRVSQVLSGEQDASIQIRLNEAADTRRTMAIEGTLANQLVGFGHGASYVPHISNVVANIDPATGRVHNIHMTPYQVLFRYGWIGLVLFVGLIGAAVLRAWQGYRPAGPSSRSSSPSRWRHTSSTC